LPIIHIDQLSIKDESYKILNESQTEFEFDFEHAPSSIGKIRLYRQLESSMGQMKEFGINEEQLDEFKSIFTDTDLYLVFLTFFVSVFHVGQNILIENNYKSMHSNVCFSSYSLNFLHSKMT
jgi:hypothetical protein